MSAQPTLYGIFLSGPTYKVALALSLMGRPFSYVHVNLRNGESKTPEFLALNRYGQVPVLVDGPLTLCQSGAILQYLAAGSGLLGGATPHDAALVREWMFWAADRLTPNVYRSRAAKLGFRSFADDVLALYAGEGKAALDQLEAALAGQNWLAGAAPSIADVDVYGVVRYAPEGGFDLATYPAINGWMERLRALPGYGAPEELLPKESRA